jgi:hypothetical protein
MSAPMGVSGHTSMPTRWLSCSARLTLLLVMAMFSRLCVAQSALPVYTLDDRDHVIGSTYIPVDNWVYDAMVRLQALGYVDSAFLGIRPWTRRSVLAMLAETAPKLEDNPGDDEAREIYLALERELKPTGGPAPTYFKPHAMLETVYARALGIGGLPLRDSFHLGQTIADDYARPYQQGFNSIAGFSTRSQAGRFSLYVRAEYQHAPSAAGYSRALAETLSSIDMVPFASNPVQATIPEGPIPSANYFRIVEANLGYRIAGHQISIGKSDHWLGPAKGGSLAYSNNAENIYAFQIDRTDLLKVPLLSRVTGPFRYVFFVGSLKGHTDPNSPWLHVEKISFKPTENLEFGFERATIWGGKGHVPITLHTFLKSFFSFQNVTLAEKMSRSDPGARFGAFDFSYRLPLLRKWVTLYSDSSVHDDVSPIDAPRHAAIRPGLYLSHFPGAPHLDLRVEAADTDPPTGRSQGGSYLFTEFIQKQGYTNKGFILGDVIGREAKGGQAWLTYHLSPREQVQLSWRSAKVPIDFIPGGTTQNLFQVSAVKRIRNDFEAKGYVQYERWVAPIYQPGQHSDVAASFQLTWYLPEKSR